MKFSIFLYLMKLLVFFKTKQNLASFAPFILVLTLDVV